MGSCPACLWGTANFWRETQGLINIVIIIKKKKIKAILKSLDTLNPLGLVSESPELEINIITNSFPTAQN